MIHLRYSYNMGGKGHAITQMKTLGISYSHATPQSLYDQWWFWNCKNIPDILPKYLNVLAIDPLDAVGYGLSQFDAYAIIKDSNDSPGT